MIIFSFKLLARFKKKIFNKKDQRITQKRLTSSDHIAIWEWYELIFQRFSKCINQPD